MYQKKKISRENLFHSSCSFFLESEKTKRNLKEKSVKKYFDVQKEGSRRRRRRIKSLKRNEKLKQALD
jgi:hypothetical protein